MLHVIEQPTRHLFFTGKGGVGKTSLAAATAIALADRGGRVLLVSTDPASNLGQVLESEVTDVIRSADAVPGLSTLNIDPEAAAQAYRDRVIDPVREVLPEDAVNQMVEQLSGACTTEIAAFDEFTKLLTDPSIAAEYDHVVFDTAPTGHTLRLLQLPAAWSNFIDTNPDGSSCLGPMSGLEAQRTQYAAAVRALADARETTLVLVTRPEPAALAEAARTSAELSALGIKGQRLIINGTFTAAGTAGAPDPLAAALERRASDALARMPERLRRIPHEAKSLRATNLVGVSALRDFIADAPEQVTDSTAPEQRRDLPASMGSLLDELEAAGHGLIMVMGKGGVGKTTIAAAAAVELASRGVPVHLSTTDPAAHVADALDGVVEGLTVSRIDPRVETENYIRRVLQTKGKDLDDAGRALLEEDLRSPCTEEVAVFHAFSRIVNEARRGVVVLDTAPTGHTLLLLDATGAYHREVLRTSSMPAQRVVTPMMRLQDPDHTRILIVTLPETTPVLEAEALQADLRRAGIEPFAWIINQSLAAAETVDPLLAARAVAEYPLIERVRTDLAARCAIVPMKADPPVGAARLRELVTGGVRPCMSV
jgi:arsenite/tail-anchored protein-transporting ATPase